MFPFVGSIAEGGAGSGTTNCGPGTTANMPMPTGIAAGDLLIALVNASIAGATISDATNGWTEIVGDSSSTLGQTSTALYKVAAGSDVLSMARASSCNMAWSVYRIPASCWHGTTAPEGAVVATSPGNNPDCPSLNPSGWGTEDTLWIAGFGWKYSGTRPEFAFPPNYTKDQTYTGAGGNGIYGRAIMAARELNAASEDPGTFNSNANGGHAFTIAVRPKATANDVEKKFIFVDAVPSGATLHRTLQDGGANPTMATTGTGWTVGNKAIGQCCLQHGGSVAAIDDSGWSATTQPSAAPSLTVGDGWRSANVINGTFANAPWYFRMQLLSVTAAYTGRCKLAVRMWRSTDANGAGAVEITSGRVVSSATGANLSTNAFNDTSLEWTWSPGATVTLAGEYLFVNVGIEITAAGSGATQDALLRVGPHRILTPIFTEAPTLVQYYLGEDITSGSWTPSTGTTLFGTVDETVADDSDYDSSALGQSDDTMELKFVGVLTPNSSDQHTVSYRIKGDGGTNIAVGLYCGATLIQSWTHMPAPASWTTYNQSVDVGNVGNITNYGDLRLRITAS